MSVNSNNTFTIYVNDTEFDEENVGIISIWGVFEKSAVNIKISSEDNGTAEVSLNIEEIITVISALDTAFEIFSCKNIISKNNRSNVITLSPQNSTDTVIIDTFKDERVGICISLTKGADPEIWLDIDNTQQIIDALKSLLQTVSK